MRAAHLVVSVVGSEYPPEGTSPDMERIQQSETIIAAGSPASASSAAMLRTVAARIRKVRCAIGNHRLMRGAPP